MTYLAPPAEATARTQSVAWAIALVWQSVRIGAAEKIFRFAKDEVVLVEISHKYNDVILGEILAGSGLQIVVKVSDNEGLFYDYVLIIGN